MAFQPGSVTVDGSGSASGSGLAKDIYDDLLATLTLPDGAPGASGKQQIANLASIVAQRTLAHIAANGVVTVQAGQLVTGTAPSGGGPIAGAVTAAAGTGTIA